MEQLKRLRTEKGLSQAKLAALADIDPSTVNQIERGAREASPATLRKLAQALDVSIAELLEDTAPKAGSRSSLEPSLNDVLAEERRANWRSAVDDARRLREGARARLEDLLKAWHASRASGELRSARRGYRDEIQELFNRAYDAPHTLASILFAEGRLPEPDDWEEVRAADLFYRDLIEMMRREGFVIEERQSGPPKIEEPAA
jgi:transcriptional regulator with XRE-family HTH domain